MKLTKVLREERGSALAGILVFAGTLAIATASYFAFFRNNQLVVMSSSGLGILDEKRDAIIAMLGDTANCSKRLVPSNGTVNRSTTAANPMKVYVDLQKQNSIVASGEVIDQLTINLGLRDLQFFSSNPTTGETKFIAKLKLSGTRSSNVPGKREVTMKDIGLSVTLNTDNHITHCDTNPELFGLLINGKTVLDCLDQNGKVRQMVDGKICMVPDMDLARNDPPLCPIGWTFYRIGNNIFQVRDSSLNAARQTGCMGVPL